MFEIGRELKRFFQPDAVRDGLCHGDSTLLDLIDSDLLAVEARSADIAAGRIGAKDRPRRLIEASRVWRELGRRTGDPVALRKAAASAERAAGLARKEGRRSVLATALVEQAQATLAGSDLFGDEGLDAAAEALLSDAPVTPEVLALRAAMAGRAALAGANPETLQSAAAAFDPLLAPSGHGRRRLDALARARLRLVRAEMLIGAAARLKDAGLAHRALADVSTALQVLSSTYHPVVLAQALELKGVALTRVGELGGDLAPVLEGLDALDDGLEMITADHSPMDWARLHHARGLALALIGEAAESEPAFLKALQAYGHALEALAGATDLPLRTIIAQDRAACLVRRAETKGDLYALDEAEAVLRGELAALRAPPEPLAWAVLQLNLARIYQDQAAARGRDRGEGARAGEALLAALDVFSERGLRSLTIAAEAALERLREASPAA